MRLLINLNGGAVTLNINDTQPLAAVVTLKGGQDVPIELMFHRDGAPELLPSGTAITFGIKKTGDFEGQYLAVAPCYDSSSIVLPGTTFVAPGDVSGFYTATLITDTTAIRTALNIDGTVGNDLATIDNTIVEIAWQVPGATRPARALTFTISIADWVIQTGTASPTLPTSYPAASMLVLASQINQPLGVAGLDVNGNIIANVIPISGTAAQINALTLANGQLAVCTDLTPPKGRYRIGDAATAGGLILPVGARVSTRFGKSTVTVNPSTYSIAATVSIAANTFVTLGQEMVIRGQFVAPGGTSGSGNAILSLFSTSSTYFIPVPAAGTYTFELRVALGDISFISTMYGYLSVWSSASGGNGAASLYLVPVSSATLWANAQTLYLNIRGATGESSYILNYFNVELGL